MDKKVLPTLNPSGQSFETSLMNQDAPTNKVAQSELKYL